MLPFGVKNELQSRCMKTAFFFHFACSLTGLSSEKVHGMGDFLLPATYSRECWSAIESCLFVRRNVACAQHPCIKVRIDESSVKNFPLTNWSKIVFSSFRTNNSESIGKSFLLAEQSLPYISISPSSP